VIWKCLNQLSTTLEAFAQLQSIPDSWRWNEGQSLADYVAGLPDSQEHRRCVQAVQRQIMQAQRASSYEAEAAQRHALKAASYARFSSPMREVVGIFTHKELLVTLKDTATSGDADHALREAVIESANHARQRQRKLDKTNWTRRLNSLPCIASFLASWHFPSRRCIQCPSWVCEAIGFTSTLMTWPWM